MAAEQNTTEAPGDRTLQEDLDRVAESDLPFGEMAGARVLVTGATGLVGSLTVKALACASRERGLSLTILPMVRSEEKARRVFGGLWDRENIRPVYGDVRAPWDVPGPVDYIIHCASVTASKTMVEKPAETLDIALMGTKNALELARAKQIRSMVYVSSMEAFGRPDPSLPSVREADLGYVDLASVRSCYPEGKRVCELMSLCCCREYGVPVKTARLAQTFGAGVDRSEGRVFAQFAKSAMDGTDIVLHTKGESFGNYCYTADAVRGILTVLLRGQDGETYTVANPRTAMRIRDMAQLVADHLAGGRIRVVFDIPEDAMKFGYAPDVVMRLNSDKLQSLGWKPEYDLPQMYGRLAESFRNQGYGAEQQPAGGLLTDSV